MRKKNLPVKRRGKISAASIFLIIISLLAFLFALYKIKTTPTVTDNGKSVLGAEKATELRGPQTTPPSSQSIITQEPEPEMPVFPKDITAKSYIVYDLDKKKVLAQKNSEMALPPASTTKMVTALVALDEFALNKHVTVPKECVGLPGVNIGFSAGDELSVQQLLYALLLPSASDAACTLAYADGNPSMFLAKMNKKAEELGLKHTYFENEIGLDDENHFSSAEDLLAIARYAMQNIKFMQIVGAPYYNVRAYNSDHTYRVDNTNELLSYVPGTVGIKTGYTDNASGCLVYAYENKAVGKRAIIVVMGSAGSEGEKRFTDTKELLDWFLSVP